MEKDICCLLKEEESLLYNEFITTLGTACFVLFTVTVSRLGKSVPHHTEITDLQQACAFMVLYAPNFTLTMSLKRSLYSVLMKPYNKPKPHNIQMR